MGNQTGPACAKNPKKHLKTHQQTLKSKESPLKPPPILKKPIKIDKNELYITELGKSLDFLSNFLSLRDISELNFEILTNSSLLTYNSISFPSNSENYITFDAILKNTSFKKTLKPKNIYQEIELELNGIKTLDFRGVSSDPQSNTYKNIYENHQIQSHTEENHEKTEKNEKKPRNSKEKNSKILRNSLKSIKENSSSLFSNRFETDGDSEKEQKLPKRPSKKGENSKKTIENIEDDKKSKKTHESSPEKRDFEFEEIGHQGYQSKGDAKNVNNPLTNLAYSKITYVEADQTQSAFGRLSFGSDQYHQIIDDKLTTSPERKELKIDKIIENKKITEKFVESETESQRKESSLQNSKLKDQILKILGQIEPNTNKSAIKHENPLKNNENPILYIEPISSPQKTPKISITTEEITKEIPSKYVKKTNISHRSINKSSLSNRSLTPTPKNQQLKAMNHYLNNEKNSYAALNKQRKVDTSHSYQKLLNTSNIDLKIEKSGIGNGSYIISPINKKNQRNIHINVNNHTYMPNTYMHKNENTKETHIFTNISKNDGKKMNNYENIATNEENKKKQAEIDLNVKIQGFLKKNEILTKENRNLQNFIEKEAIQKNIITNTKKSSENEEVLLNVVKHDIENLKNRMKDTFSDKYINMPTSEKKIDEKNEKLAKPEGNSLKDRINQALSKKNLQEIEEKHEPREIKLQEVMDLLPDYDPISYENAISDEPDEDSD